MNMKLAALLFIVIAPTLAGIGALVPMTMYGTVEIPPMAIPVAAAIGVAIAIPAALILSGKLGAAFSPRA